jgi:superfamily I DNA/RNA helicase
MSDVIPSAVIDAPARVHQIVLGAPGSGKTELLQQRFLALVEQGVHPDNVLVATPTRHQASHLRDVLGLRLGQATQGARVRSLAALAFSLLESFHRQRGLPAPDLMKASQIDLDIQALLTGHEEDGSGPAWPEMFGPEVRATRVFRQELREWIARAGEKRRHQRRDSPRGITFRPPGVGGCVRFSRGISACGRQCSTRGL